MATTRALAAAGLPDDVRIHDLRHTCASRHLARGVPLQVVKDMLGHSQISVTSDIYGHTSPESMREALRRAAM